VETWKLTVWTRFDAPLATVWDQKTEPLALAREFLPYLRVSVEDVDGLRRAMRETGHGVFRGRVTGPLGIFGVAWPFDIRETRPPRYYRDASKNLLYREFLHEHRFEELGTGKVRYVDDVTFVPAGAGRLTAEVTRLLFVHRHHRAARELKVDDGALARTWLRSTAARVPADVAPTTP
jgi:ligand-binding SRPBCC domain-containing protein